MFFSPSPPESLITNGVLVVTVLPESPVALGPPVAAPLREQNCGKENQAQLGPLPQSPLGGRLTEARQREPGHGGGSSWAPAPGGKISGPSPHLPQPCPRNPLIKAPTSLLRRCLVLEESVFCGLCLWALRVPGKRSV